MKEIPARPTMPTRPLFAIGLLTAVTVLIYLRTAITVRAT